MEFRETLLAAQRNQQQKSSENYYYKARFDPPKKEQKAKDRLSANIQKFLAKKDEEEKQKKLEAQRKRDELFAMRDTKALKKIQKTLKVIKSANKSVLADAIDRDHTAVTREGPDQPDQDDYGYESQEAAALYEKMMQKYSKLPDEPKFPVASTSVNKDLNGTRERVRNALLHEDEPVPHKRRRKGENADRDSSPPSKYEPEKKKEDKPEKPKFRKPAPPPMDFNQLLKLAEQKKSEPVDVIAKKAAAEPEPDRLMTKKQKREYEEEMARRLRRQERLEAEKSGGKKVQADTRGERQQAVDKERKPDTGFNRIPKLGDKVTNNHRNEVPKTYGREKEKEKHVSEREKHVSEREKYEKMQREKEKAKNERDKERLDRERLERLKAERDRIDRELDRLNKDKDKLDKSKAKLESRSMEKNVRPVDKAVDRTKLGSRDQIVKQDAKKSIDLKTQNTYRIDKNSNEKTVGPGKNIDSRGMNGYSSQGKPVPKLSKDQISEPRNGLKDKMISSKPRISSEGSQKLNGHVKLENGKRPEDRKSLPAKKPDDRRPLPGSGRPQAGPSKPKVSNSFDFDKHVNSLSKNTTKQFPPGHVKRKPNPDDLKKKKSRMVHSDSEYDSEMDDFIDDGDENMDYSHHIKEIFGYDRSKYRDMDDDDDPAMESSFARQQREEYISKKIGIMEDLEDMRMEAMEKKKSKRRRLSDD
ncbi:protein SPT2 homolog [Epargyreus clarus]|uniref:protein SPT2 homolog n=1 Tax=Epargyreus clarus TaxID=520877 RepID=UPI003C2E1D27